MTANEQAADERDKARADLHALRTALVEATMEPFDIGPCYIAGPLPLKQKHDGEAFAVQHERMLGVFWQLLDRVEAKAAGTTDACNRVWRERDRLRAQRDELRARLRHDCKGCPGCASNDCPDALDAAQHECDRLRAENETLRKRAVECMPMLETLREALGADLGSGGGFVSVLDGIDRLRAQRDALVAVLEQCDVFLRVHAKPDNELKTAVQAAIRAAKENQ